MDDDFVKSVIAKIDEAVPAQDPFARECRDQIIKLARTASSENEFHEMLIDHAVDYHNNLVREMNDMFSPRALRELYEAAKRPLS
jgi:hypothetical protein